MWFLGEFLAVLLTLITVLCAYIKWKHSHWERLGVPHLPSQFPWGSVKNNPFSRKKAAAIIVRDLHEEIKERGLKFAGVVSFLTASVMVVDPEIVRLILTKDFVHFVDRMVPDTTEREPLAGNLFGLKGAKWKKLRAKLTPTFTSGKMRMMLDNVVECGKPLRDVLQLAVVDKEPLETKELFGRFTADVIGSCAFGLDCNSFKDKDSEFLRYCKLALNPTTWDNFRTIITMSFPRLANLLRVKMTNPNVENFFMNVTRDTIELRRNGFRRNDFMQLLVELIKNDENPNGLTLEEIAAQAFIFFIAGFDTSSTTGAFCMMELARNQEVQEKVRQEIEEVIARHGGNITYDALQEMKYLGQVIDETLRLYPPLAFLMRECTLDYTIPYTDVHIEKGVHVLISVLALQRDPKYFPDPDSFNPDRFSEENRQKIVPYTYLPFGEGPRICIGMRFGLMQTKVGLVTLLRGHKYTLNSKTQLPPTFDPNGMLLSPVGGIWLDVEKVRTKE